MVKRVTTVTRRYEWDMAHRLPLHEGKCYRLHGHRYVAEIDFTGTLYIAGPSEGMVADFDDLKRCIDTAIGMWDHRCMVWEEDPRVQENEDLGVFTVRFMPTAENLAHEIARLVTTRLAGAEIKAQVTRVRVYETPNGWAEVVIPWTA